MFSTDFSRGRYFFLDSVSARSCKVSIKPTKNATETRRRPHPGLMDGRYATVLTRTRFTLGLTYDRPKTGACPADSAGHVKPTLSGS